MLSEVKFTLNGKKIIYQGDPLRRLLDVIREDLGFTGTKEGCSEGECGACSVIKDGRLVTSCIIPIGACNGSDILTIEGIRDTEKGECIISAFAEGGAVQCGFCIQRHHPLLYSSGRSEPIIMAIKQKSKCSS